ncbi:MAG TPA: Xaa-Pro peptidase family protein [Clostridia bacterium]|nr:Xaa-Pro peptidase family protein [Clostridia bacterium]
MDYSGRQRRLLQSCERLRLDALLVTHLSNVRYLCGFTGSAGVLLMTPRPVFFTDGRYGEQARAQVKGARVVVAKGSPLAAAANAIGKKISSIGVEADHVSLTMRAGLRKVLPKHTRLRETSGLVEVLRSVKEAEEVERIRYAVVLGAKLLKPALRAIKPGVPESTVAAEIEYAARRAGAEGMSFETIVASGARSALPHGVASVDGVAAKGFVVLDFGVILHGYCSDMTRTVHVGRVSSEYRALYGAVLDAQMAAIDAVAPGVELGKVDEAARSVLRRARLDRYFTHSTGHGVGLEIHEQPRVARAQREQLRQGMVITIEPGIYLPGKAGIRIEDMVVVTETGCEVLTPASKELIEL